MLTQLILHQYVLNKQTNKPFFSSIIDSLSQFHNHYKLPLQAFNSNLTKYMELIPWIIWSSLPDPKPTSPLQNSSRSSLTIFLPSCLWKRRVSSPYQGPNLSCMFPEFSLHLGSPSFLFVLDKLYEWEITLITSTSLLFTLYATFLPSLIHAAASSFLHSPVTWK